MYDSIRSKDYSQGFKNALEIYIQLLSEEPLNVEALKERLKSIIAFQQFMINHTPSFKFKGEEIKTEDLPKTKIFDEEVLVCKGCGHLKDKPLKAPAVACCPDSNYIPLELYLKYSIYVEPIKKPEGNPRQFKFLESLKKMEITFEDYKKGLAIYPTFPIGTVQPHQTKGPVFDKVTGGVKPGENKTDVEGGLNSNQMKTHKIWITSDGYIPFRTKILNYILISGNFDDYHVGDHVIIEEVTFPFFRKTGDHLHVLVKELHFIGDKVLLLFDMSGDF